MNRGSATSGQGIIAVNAVLTGVFVLSALLATAVFEAPWTRVAVGVDLVCFTTGVVAFLWGYWEAVQRSRTETIGVAMLWFLLGDIAPRRVKATMNALLVVQSGVGVVTASVRSSTAGRPGSTLAFGILVPMMGLGLNGLWGATAGTFRPRADGGTGEMSSRGAAGGQDVGHE